MLKKVVALELYDALTKVGFDNIYEVRLRAGLPISIVSAGQVYYLSANGLTYNKHKALCVDKKAIEDIIYKASEFSIYSIAEELKQGFVVLNNGVRIGVAGNVITENGKIGTITNFSSLNIRIPHIIRGTCLPVFDYLMDKKGVFNTLIISPPGQGKTTFLRDFAFQLSEKNFFYNVLVIDERGEIAGKDNALSVGECCDVLAFSTKQIGFLQGIRAMNPDIIITDELGQEEDFLALKNAASCGVKVVASIHGASIDNLKDKPYFNLIKSSFQRYVCLKPSGKAGQILGVYDQNFNPLKEWIGA